MATMRFAGSHVTHPQTHLKTLLSVNPSQRRRAPLRADHCASGARRCAHRTQLREAPECVRSDPRYVAVSSRQFVFEGLTAIWIAVGDKSVACYFPQNGESPWPSRPGQHRATVVDLNPGPTLPKFITCRSPMVRLQLASRKLAGEVCYRVRRSSEASFRVDDGRLFWQSTH